MQELRQVLRWDPITQEKTRIDFKDLKEGDRFTLYEADGEYVGTWTAINDAYITNGDVWTIDI